MTTSVITAQGNKPRSILVVDDNASIRNLIADLFNARGYVVASAYDCASAIVLAAARAASFDIVVTDVQMPGASGFELSDALVSGTHGPAVLFMSGSADYARRGELPATTVHGFIAKPFSATELLLKVEDLLAERARRKASGR